jgi:hypothetical protein
MTSDRAKASSRKKVAAWGSMEAGIHSVTFTCGFECTVGA